MLCWFRQYFFVEESCILSFAMPSVLSKCVTASAPVTSASLSAFGSRTLRGSLPKYLKVEAWDRRHKRRELLLARFRALIPDCFFPHNRAMLALSCCIRGEKLPPSVTEVAVWLWTAQLIPRIVRLEQVVAIVATFIAASLSVDCGK